MPTLNGQIDFTVKFDLTGSPTLKLQATSSIPAIDQPNLTGFFYIKQPDGIDRTGDYITPDVTWTGLGYPEFSIPLRPASDGTYQRGDYTIEFFAQCPGYTPGTNTKSWNSSFKAATEILTQLFDLYTPSLKYRNDTVYTNGDYTIIAQSETWAATSVPGTPAPSTTPNFDLIISGNYYDSIYNITHTKQATYQNNALSWFSIIQGWSSTITAAAYIPASMLVLLGYLDALKAAKDANSCDKSLDETYKDAETLYSHIRTKVCLMVVTGLKSYFDEFYRLTHNYQNPVYVNTDSIIPPYDFTTGCAGSGGGGGGGTFYSTRAPIGINTFTVTALAGKTIKAVSRSGLNKGITSSVTTDSEFLQIVGNVVTLPVGDVVNAITQPDLSVVGELFLFTY